MAPDVRRRLASTKKAAPPRRPVRSRRSLPPRWLPKRHGKDGGRQRRSRQGRNLGQEAGASEDASARQQRRGTRGAAADQEAGTCQAGGTGETSRSAKRAAGKAAASRQHLGGPAPLRRGRPRSRRRLLATLLGRPRGRLRPRKLLLLSGSPRKPQKPRKSLPRRPAPAAPDKGVSEQTAGRRQGCSWQAVWQGRGWQGCRWQEGPCREEGPRATK